MTNKIYSIAIGGILLVLLGILSVSVSTADDELYRQSGGTPMPNVWTSPVMPVKADFAGEVIPLEYFDVRESLERELIVNMNFHSNTLQYLKRVDRYFPIIEPILKEYGIPDDFKYLALIESDFMNKVSPRGATGFWQFMKDAAIEQGLEINAEIDERYHLEKSTIAACKYLKECYLLFEKNWTLAAAAYNMGKKGLKEQMIRQKSNYYHDLLLNEETMRYIYRIVAVKEILNHPELYGFNVSDAEKYPVIPYSEIEVDTAVNDWADFAKEYNINYKILKYMNPWLRDNKLTNKNRKTYKVKIISEEFRDRDLEN